MWPVHPPPAKLFNLSHPLIVGLTTSPDRLVQVRRNRLLALKQAPETAYVDPEKVTAELAFARRLFADNGWTVIDVTRRSIEATAARLEERGVGKECVSTCRFRWCPYHINKKPTTKYSFITSVNNEYKHKYTL